MSDKQRFKTISTVMEQRVSTQKVNWIGINIIFWIQFNKITWLGSSGWHSWKINLQILYDCMTQIGLQYETRAFKKIDYHCQLCSSTRKFTSWSTTLSLSSAKVRTHVWNCTHFHSHHLTHEFIQLCCDKNGCGLRT